MSTVPTEIRNSQTNSHQAHRNSTENQETLIICPDFDIQTPVNFTNSFFQFWMQPIPELNNEIQSLLEHKTSSSFLLSKNAEKELPCKHKQNGFEAFC